MQGLKIYGLVFTSKKRLKGVFLCIVNYEVPLNGDADFKIEGRMFSTMLSTQLIAQ